MGPPSANLHNSGHRRARSKCPLCAPRSGLSAQSYLIAGANTFSIVIGMTITVAGMTIKRNRAGL
jgi:hypothetical protein